jgi:hypothetical protein
MIPRYAASVLREDCPPETLAFAAAGLVQFADAARSVALSGALAPSAADAMAEIGDRARRLAGHAQARAGSLIAAEALGEGERE